MHVTVVDTPRELERYPSTVLSFRTPWLLGVMVVVVMVLVVMVVMMMVLP
jgi:hypothetical protein